MSYTTPSGYQLVGFIQPRSTGWIGTPYVESWNDVGVNLWWGSTGNGTVTVTGMFIKSALYQHSVSQSIESLNVKVIDRMSGGTTLTVEFGDDVRFRTVFIIFGMQNNNIPVFSIIGLQFESGDGAASTSIKNLTEYGVTSASISGRNVTIVMNTANWGDLYGLCAGGTFERI